jgi:CheY-like chemotaxis protein
MTKVLIADDEPDVLESTAMLVESMGYHVSTVQDPNEVLETIERERPGLVLQDLRMGGLNVAALMATLRSNPDTADIPVVFFSANADLPMLAARYDAWGYLAKPFGQEELQRLLGQVLGPSDAKTSRPIPEVRREVRATFHDYWNLLAALSNYIQILDKAKVNDTEAQRAVRGLDELVLKLESKTDRLRAYILGVIDSFEPPGEEEEEARPPPPEARKDSADKTHDTDKAAKGVHEAKDRHHAKGSHEATDAGKGAKRPPEATDAGKGAKRPHEATDSKKPVRS